jgi:hypothetical protein
MTITDTPTLDHARLVDWTARAVTLRAEAAKHAEPPEIARVTARLMLAELHVHAMLDACRAVGDDAFAAALAVLLWPMPGVTWSLDDTPEPIREALAQIMPLRTLAGLAQPHGQ